MLYLCFFTWLLLDLGVLWNELQPRSSVKKRPQNAQFHKSCSIFWDAKNCINLGTFSSSYEVSDTYLAGESD